MSTAEQLKERSGGQCELCTATGQWAVYSVAPVSGNIKGNEIWICSKCVAQIDKKEDLDKAHWSSLSTTMWSEVPAVQVAAWRMLNRLRDESWAADCIDMLFLDDETMEWAKATGDHELDAAVDLHRDANGHVLENGDSVVLVKSLDVKGSTVNARLGTVVKNIRLVPDNTAQIEGKIEGQTIVILTKYLRKQNAAIIT